MFRFTIRDVLWLMVVVGLGTALWIERSRVAAVTADRDHKATQVESLDDALRGLGWEPGWNGDNQENVTLYKRPLLRGRRRGEIERRKTKNERAVQLSGRST